MPSTVKTAAQTHVLGLQASAGNAAVSGFLQRQPQAGWSDADPAVDPAVNFSWNKERHSVGSIGRYPLQGLPEGNQEEWKGSESMKLTTEGAKGKAIALVPAKLNPADPVTVFVLLHGYAEDASTRPYGGWRQHKRTHKVRDVEHDRIAQQIEATGDKQIIGLLPQGGERSQFGKEAAKRKDPFKPYNTFFSDAYVTEALKELKRVGGLASIPTKVKVAIAAHSGGGHTVRSMLVAENEKRVGRPPGDHSSAPASLGEVVLFDAMTWDELGDVKTWVLGELDELLAALTAAKPADKQKVIDAAPRFRGYYTLGESYVAKYKDLERAIRGWFLKNNAALGTWADKVWPLFQVVPWGGKAGETHETIIRGTSLKVTQAAGNLTDALNAIKNPTARDPVPVPPPPKPRSSTKARPKARAR